MNSTEDMLCVIDTEEYIEKMLIEACSALQRNKCVLSGSSFIELNRIKEILETLDLLRDVRLEE